FFDRIWTWSVLYSGMMAASKATGDPRYQQALLAMAGRSDWQLRSHLPNADDQSIGQTYLDFYLLQHGPQQLQPTRSALDSVLPLATLTPTDDRIPWWWCDALFMAPPVWA